MNVLQYKGYVGVFKFDPEAHVFHGDIINTRDVITFEGRSVEELEQAIRESVEDYLDFCRSTGKEPDKPFSGRFMLRLKPEVHRAAAIAAQRQGKSLNAWAAEALAKAAAAE